MKNKCFISFILLFYLILPSYAEAQTQYPDFASTFLGEDKFENFNRKMFIFNGALNKYALRPASKLWAAIMPKYGMERIKYAYSNILYPRRLVSTLIQKDFRAAKDTTTRFLVNSTVGLGGMFDPAKKFLKISPVNEDMEQALAKLKVKSGPYLVVPFFASSTPRSLFGRALDSALDPTSYVGSPVIAGIKACFTLNNLAMGQGLIKTVENNFSDPYTIAKTMYGLKNHIMNNNYDRKEVLKKAELNAKNEENPLNNLADTIDDNSFVEVNNEDEIKIITPKDSEIINAQTVSILPDVIKGGTSTDEILYEDDELTPDLILKDYNPQHPIIDSMRTALFEIEGVDKSIWDEMSVWNRSFQNRIKTDSVLITENREKYKFRYIMQKDKNSPVAIIYPSVGEGINSHHSTQIAKLFYDEGYSVAILGSAFHFSFVNSMPETYRPGIPEEDVHLIKKTTSKVLESLENKYECKFKDKVVLGTSFGALSSLFLAEEESKNNSLNISKYISICPPVELMYAINSIDETSKELNRNDIKENAALTAAKVMQAYDDKKEGEFKGEQLPFSIKEAKLITSFIMHQKLTDLMFAIENINPNKKTDFYKKANNMNYKDYAKTYLLSEKYPSIEDISKSASLHKIKEYLKNNSNYRIYHTMDDYLVNYDQLKQLRRYSKNKLTLIDRGAHLGFLYRSEFIDDLKKEISLKQKSDL